MCLFTGFLLSAALISCELLQLSIINLSTDTQYLVYLMTQFFLGFSSYTYMVVSYVILVEIVSQKYSVVVTMIKCQLYVSGEFVLLAVSYLSWLAFAKLVHSWILYSSVRNSCYFSPWISKVSNFLKNLWKISSQYQDLKLLNEGC